MADETSTVNFVFTSTDKTGSVIGGIGKAFAALGVAAVAGAGLAVGALGAFAVSGIKAAASMEEQMSNIAAVMGKTKDEIAPLGDLIKDLGLDPNLKVTATEAAAAIELLARNGLSMDEILNGAAESTVLLANATGAEFGQAADIATDAMAIFGIGVADMGAAVDGIVSVTTNSKFSIDDYALALANGGARAMAAGVSFDDFNTTIGLISEEAGSGMRAGTALGGMLTRLAPQTDVAAEAMKALGIITAEGQNRFFDASGAFLGMGNAADVLNSTLGGLSDQQKMTAISTLFGVDASAAALGLMNETSATFAAAQAQMANTSAVDSAAVRMDNLSGQWEIFQGIVETVQLQIGERFLPVLKTLVSTISSVAEEHAPALTEAFGRFADWLGNVLPPIIEAIPGFIAGALEAFQRISTWFSDTVPIVVDFVTNGLNVFKAWLDDTGAIEKAQGLFNTLRDWFAATVPVVIDFVKSALEKVQEWFETNRPAINNFMENVLKPFIGLIIETATSIKDFILVQFAKISAWYKENEPLIKEFAAVMATAWGIMMVALVTFWKVVEPILSTLIDFVLEVARLIMAIATGDWETAWDSMKNIVQINIDGIKAIFGGLADWVTGFLGTTWADVVQVWKDNARQFLNIGGLIIQNIVDGIFDGLVNIGTVMTDAAQRMKDGWTLGMHNIRSAIISSALAPFQGAITAVKRLLGIASPSKLFEQLGINTGEGFAIGLAGQSSNVAAAGANMGAAAAQGATSTVTNYNLNVNTMAQNSQVIGDFQMMQAWAGA